MRSKTVKMGVIALLCAFSVLVACQPAYTYQVPEERGDGWTVGSLVDVGFDSEILERAVRRIQRGRYKDVHSLLIVKEGKLVLETYYPGNVWSYNEDEHRGDRVAFDADTLHNLASVTKSFTSSLIGIAIDRGQIGGIEERILDYYPEYAHLGDARKEAITLHHLLSMTSGLEWNENQYPYSDLRNDLVQLFYRSDPIAYILAKPAIHPPGTRWYYSGGDVNLLGEAIRVTSGQRMDHYAEQVLMAPLGITNYEWDYINEDFVHASGNLRLRPRDMAKFGLLYLNGGVWNGTRIVSQEWVERSTRGYRPWPKPEGSDYGYYWWLRDDEVEGKIYPSFSARGWGGQRIAVYPEQEMVVVMTGGSYVERPADDEILVNHVLLAIR